MTGGRGGGCERCCALQAIEWVCAIARSGDMQAVICYLAALTRLFGKENALKLAPMIANSVCIRPLCLAEAVCPHWHVGGGGGREEGSH